MGVKCIYCGSQKTYPILEIDEGVYRYFCKKCNRVFLVIKEQRDKYTRIIKLKAERFPIIIDRFVFTKEDVEREYQNYYSMQKAFGFSIPIFYDDEYLYYIGDLTAKYDGLFAGLYAGGIRIARKTIE